MEVLLVELFDIDLLKLTLTTLLSELNALNPLFLLDVSLLTGALFLLPTDSDFKKSGVDGLSFLINPLDFSNSAIFSIRF